MTNRAFEKIYLAEKYIGLDYKDKKVVLNCMNNNPALLNNDDYIFLCSLSENKDSNGAITNFNTFSQSEYEKIIQFVLNGVVSLKPYYIPKMSDRLETVYLSMTSKCNFRCIYCYADCDAEIKTFRMNKKELSLEEYFIMINKFIDSGLKNIVFTGGEPLLNQKTFDVANYAKKKGVCCTINTNGSLINENNISKMKVFDSVKLSLDSLDENINDKIRSKGCFRGVLNAVKLLNEMKIPVFIETVVSKYNYDSIIKLSEYLHKNYDIVNQFVSILVPTGRGLSKDVIGYDEFSDISEKIDEYNLSVDYAYHSKEILKKIKKGVLSIRCGMAGSEVFVDEFGDIYPCQMSYSDEYFLGNVRNFTLESFLKSSASLIKSITVDSIEGCRDCEYKYICGGGCRQSHKAYTGSLYINHRPLCNYLINQINTALFFYASTMG